MILKDLETVGDKPLKRELMDDSLSERISQQQQQQQQHHMQQQQSSAMGRPLHIIATIMQTTIYGKLKCLTNLFKQQPQNKDRFLKIGMSSKYCAKIYFRTSHFNETIVTTQVCENKPNRFYYILCFLLRDTTGRTSGFHACY